TEATEHPNARKCTPRHRARAPNPAGDEGPFGSANEVPFGRRVVLGNRRNCPERAFYVQERLHSHPYQHATRNHAVGEEGHAAHFFGRHSRSKPSRSTSRHQR